jgi:hypothetical protein
MSTARSNDAAYIPATHRRLIDRRLAQHAANPDAAITLATVKTRLRKHLSRKPSK